MLGGSFPLDVVLSTADVELTDGQEPEERLLKARSFLQQLVESGWVGGDHPSRAKTPLAETSNWYRMADLEVAEIVLAEVPYRERQAIHLRAAEALSSTAPTQSAWLPQLLYHLISAEADLAERTVVLEALEYLNRIASPFDALELLDEALQGPKGSTLRTAKECRLVHAGLLEVTDQTREAIEVYHSVRDLCETPDEHAKLSRKLGRLFGRLGEWDSAIREFDLGLKSIDDDKESLERLKLLATLAQTQLEIRSIDDCRKVVDECCELVESLGLTEDDDYLEVLRLAQEVAAGDDGEEGLSLIHI